MAWCMELISDYFLLITYLETKKCEACKPSIPSLNLLPEDRLDIVEGKWLSDNAQNRLKARHSSIGGLQNTSFVSAVHAISG